MKKTILYLTVIFFLGCSNHKNENIKISNIDFKQAVNAFSELHELLANEGGQLWNYKLDGPILLINSETRTFIANEQNEQNEFTKQGDLFFGKLPENINISNTSINWNGKHWTTAILPLPESKEERLNLLIHESFHRIQPRIGFENLIEMQNDHLDSKNGRIYLKLELEALQRALSSENPEKHIKEALKFRLYRQQLYSGSAASENSLEINEGIAEYTGSILCGMSKEDLKKHYSSLIDLFYSRPTFVRSFAYVTIPVYGYFMRQSVKAWNLKVSSKTNLTEFISDFFGVTSQNISADEINKIGQAYPLESISKFENERELKRIELIETLKKRFLGDSTFVINLQNMNIGFNPGNIMPLDTFGTVYPNIRVTDNWGILEVDSCGALLTNWVKITITPPKKITDTLITGRGWKLKLNIPWKLEKVNGRYILNKK